MFKIFKSCIRLTQLNNINLVSLLEILLELNLLETGFLQVDVLCLHWSTEGSSTKFFLVALLLNDKLLPWYSWNCGQYLFWCCYWPGFHIYGDWFLESNILTFSPIPLFHWCPSGWPLRKDCCLFLIVETTSLIFCMHLVVLGISDSNLPPNISFFSLRSFFVFLGSPVICFRALKRLAYETLL